LLLLPVIFAAVAQNDEEKKQKRSSLENGIGVFGWVQLELITQNPVAAQAGMQDYNWE